MESKKQEITVIPRGEIEPGVDLDQMVDSWLVDLKLDRLPNTVKTYSKGLRLFRRWLHNEGLTLASVRAPDVKRWREYLFSDAERLGRNGQPTDKKGYSIQTVNLWLVAVRQFYSWAIENGRTFFNPASIKGIPDRGGDKKRLDLTSAEVRSVLATCADTTEGIRDRAIICLMAYACLRTVEVHRADLEDLKTRHDRLVIDVQGKGQRSKNAYVELHVKAEEALHKWIAKRGDHEGALFTCLSNRAKGQRLSLRSIRGIVMRRYGEAGIVNSNKSTHSLRHSGITNALRHNAPEIRVKEMARHQSFDTTLGYAHEIGRADDPAVDYIDYDDNGESL